MSRKKVAVLGASGIVGQRFCQLLSDHPFFDIPDLYSSQRSGSKKLLDILRVPDHSIADELLHMKMELLDTDRIARESYDAIFCALPSSMEENVELRLSELGNRIFTNSAMNRMRIDVPIVVPEVNPEHMEMVENRSGFIIANGNCSSIGLALPIRPLTVLNPIHVEVTTLQAVSGAGYPGVPSLDALGNVIPYIESEEEKISTEVPKMLGTLKEGRITNSALRIDATCTRVPVPEGHTESVAIRFDKNVDLEKVRNLMINFRGLPQDLKLPTAPKKPIILDSRNDRPQPALDLMNDGSGRSDGMAVTVGRLRVSEDTVRFVALSHNTIRGAAGGSILNAEILYSRGKL